MRDFPSASDSGGTLLDDAFQALSELIAQRDGPTVRWFIDQQIGTPKTVQELILPPSDFIVAVATVVHDVIAVELGRADLYEDFASRMQEAVESLPS